MCSKILTHGLNHGLLFSLFKFFGWKKILNSLENSGLKSRFLFCLIFQFYLMYRLICQKPVHFLSVRMALVSTFFPMFIVLLWLLIQDLPSLMQRPCFFIIITNKIRSYSKLIHYSVKRRKPMIKLLSDVVYLLIRNLKGFYKFLVKKKYFEHWHLF